MDQHKKTSRERALSAKTIQRCLGKVFRGVMRHRIVKPWSLGTDTLNSSETSQNGQRIMKSNSA